MLPPAFKPVKEKIKTMYNKKNKAEEKYFAVIRL